jgi:hypothetical protein
VSHRSLLLQNSLSLAMFHGQSTVLEAKEVWKVKAPNGFHFFMWLAIEDRCWTSGRLHQHGLRSDATCTLCSQDSESIDHLLVSCVCNRKVWFKCLRRSGWQHVRPVADDELVSRWLHSRKQVTKASQNAFDSLCFLVARSFGYNVMI